MFNYFPMGHIHRITTGHQGHRKKGHLFLALSVQIFGRASRPFLRASEAMAWDGLGLIRALLHDLLHVNTINVLLGPIKLNWIELNWIIHRVASKKNMSGPENYLYLKLFNLYTHKNETYSLKINCQGLNSGFCLKTGIHEYSTEWKLHPCWKQDMLLYVFGTIRVPTFCTYNNAHQILSNLLLYLTHSEWRPQIFIPKRKSTSIVSSNWQHKFLYFHYKSVKFDVLCTQNKILTFGHPFHSKKLPICT